MKRFAVSLAAVVVIVLCSQSAEAQWVTRYYRPRTVIAPAPVMISPAPVVMAPPVQVVQRPVPMIVHTPEVVVATRRRPILGGTVVRTNYGNRRVTF